MLLASLFEIHFYAIKVSILCLNIDNSLLSIDGTGTVIYT